MFLKYTACHIRLLCLIGHGMTTFGGARSYFPSIIAFHWQIIGITIKYFIAGASSTPFMHFIFVRHVYCNRILVMGWNSFVLENIHNDHKKCLDSILNS